MSVRTFIRATAAVAVVTAVPLLGTSAALAADGTPSPTAGKARLVAACSRIPHRIERLERVQTRFHADASTRGSIAFLSARIDKAKAAGQNDLAQLLSDRLAVRKDIDSQLPDVLAKLHDAQQVCETHQASS